MYFNRPDQTVPIHRLREDMRAAQERLVLASAWFTDDETANAFADSHATLKLAIVSRSDLNRPGGSKQAVEILQRAQRKNSVLSIIGTGDWRTGTMHHKFVVADNIVWVGSYNFTYQAKRNYENLMRIASAELAEQFWAEALVVTGAKITQVDPPRPLPKCRECNLPSSMATAENSWLCFDCTLATCSNCSGIKGAEGTHGCYCNSSYSDDTCGACLGTEKSDTCLDCGGWIYSQGTGGCGCEPVTRNLGRCEHCTVPVGV